METIRKIRHAYFREGKAIRAITREMNLSRNTVRNIIRSGITDQKYERVSQPHPKLGSFIERLRELLHEDADKPIRHRRTAQLLFEQLQREGYEGGYDAVSVVTWESGRDRAARLLLKPTHLLNLSPATPFSSTGATSRWSWLEFR